ncbi:MAG: hypothetical protein BGO68_04820 [Candidatus Amoebophilus sp. 36-38]|nr:MAG: hypothetical protein BGO68_04820 [Candidatus Amoebophilus sp. 36-38]
MKNINKYSGYLLLSAYMLIIQACYSKFTIEELQKRSGEIEQLLEELKEEKGEIEQVIAQKARIRHIIDEFWNKVYSKEEQLFFKFDLRSYDQDYIERGGEVLYLALKGRHQEYIQDILNLNNKHLGITPEITLNKERLMGYALCLVIKDIEFDLKDVFEIITTRREFESITQIRSIDEYIAMSWIEAIRKREGSLIKIWKTRLKALYTISIPQEDYHNFNKIVWSLIALLINDQENKLAFSIKDFEECFRYVEFSNEQLELLASSENLTKEVQQHLPNLIEQYKKSKEKLSACTSIQRRHNQLSISKKRELNEYSDSEEEDAPHFNGVYNLTKSRTYGISYDMDDIEDIEDYLRMEAAGKVVNNYVMRRDEIYPDKLKKDAEEIHSGLSQKVTVLCAALQQQDGRTKKFVFTNESSLSQSESELKKGFLLRHIN